MMRHVLIAIAIILVVVGAVGLLWGPSVRDVQELAILEVESAEGLVPAVLGRGCPVVVMAADGVADAIARVYPLSRPQRHQRGSGPEDVVVAADFAVLLPDGDKVRVVHPSHRPVLSPSDGGLVVGRGWRDERWGYVEVRLPPGGCLVLPRNWGVAGWTGEAFHVTSVVRRGVRALLGSVHRH